MDTVDWTVILELMGTREQRATLARKELMAILVYL